MGCVELLCVVFSSLYALANSKEVMVEEVWEA